MKAKTSRRSIGRAIALIAVVPWVASATETATDTSEDKNKTQPAYTLFTGTNIDVLHNDTLCRVHGVDDDAFLITVDGKTVRFSMGTNLEKLKVSRSQELADRSATVTNYKYERVYTPANDPHRKFFQEMRGLAAATDSAQRLETIRDKTPAVVRKVDAMTGEVSYVANEEHAHFAAEAQKANTSISGDMGASSAYTQRLADELALKLFDALDVQFEVSAAKPIQNPYVVVMATYREKDDTKHVRKWLFAKALPPIDAQPRKVSVQEGGFPAGFTVENLQIHLYENGVEIATNQSENRASLTREEAHEYLMIEYVSQHKNDTKKPQLALAELPADWTARRNEESFRKIYYVKVDKTGRPGGAFEDESCTKPAADPACADVLNSLLFLPALEKGTPVAGVIRVSPAGRAK